MNINAKFNEIGLHKSADALYLRKVTTQKFLDADGSSKHSHSILEPLYCLSDRKNVFDNDNENDDEYAPSSNAGDDDIN